MSVLNKARGCLLAGGIGDALGYPVEFMSGGSIRHRYGKDGIQALEVDFETGTAVVSDDTQMTLFTANGLLLAAAHPGRRTPEAWLYTAYRDWLLTQTPRCKTERLCWILDLPELHALRAPGNTCLSALRSGEMGSVDEPINMSKGCGGVMRVAPVAVHGFAMGWDVEKVIRLAAEAAAITHGHGLGWLSAAGLAGIIYYILGGDAPDTAAGRCAEDIGRVFSDDCWTVGFCKDMLAAVDLAHGSAPDGENIEKLGEGWVGDEALYIALYCAVRYMNDFDRCMAVSVNHKGDSDSTGAIAGNIIGAYIGEKAIGEKWKTAVQFHDLLISIADDLCAAEDSRTEQWQERYCRGK